MQGQWRSYRILLRFVNSQRQEEKAWTPRVTITCHYEEGRTAPTRQSSGTFEKCTCFCIVIARRPEWGDAAIQRMLGHPTVSAGTPHNASDWIATSPCDSQ
jgi:hypothetical protein